MKHMSMGWRKSHNMFSWSLMGKPFQVLQPDSRLPFNACSWCLEMICKRHKCHFDATGFLSTWSIITVEVYLDKKIQTCDRSSIIIGLTSSDQWWLMAVLIFSKMGKWLDYCFICRNMIFNSYTHHYQCMNEWGKLRLNRFSGS